MSSDAVLPSSTRKRSSRLSGRGVDHAAPALPSVGQGTALPASETRQPAVEGEVSTKVTTKVAAPAEAAGGSAAAAAGHYSGEAADAPIIGNFFERIKNKNWR